MTDQPTTTAPETTCLGCPGCGGPDCIQRAEPMDPVLADLIAEARAEVTAVRKGIGELRAEIARERAAHEEHRRQLADALGGLDESTSWTTLIRLAEQHRRTRHDWHLKAAEIERDRNRLARLLEQAEAERENHRSAVCAALGRHLGLDWPTIVQRVETVTAAAKDRADILEEARDALSAAGQNGPHGDDWPAIAPAIRALAADRDEAREEALDRANIHEGARLTLADALGCDVTTTWADIAETARRIFAAGPVRQAAVVDAEQELKRARRGETEAIRAREAAERDALQARIRSGRNLAEAQRNHDAWRNARKRAAVLSAEITRRAPMLGEYATRAQQAEATLARVRAVAEWAKVGWTDLSAEKVLAALGDDQPAEDPALAEIERLGTELYRAQDALAFAGECCDIADRNGRTITTADVRKWLLGPQCARQAGLVITEGPIVDAVQRALGEQP